MFYVCPLSLQCSLQMSSDVIVYFSSINSVFWLTHILQQCSSLTFVRFLFHVPFIIAFFSGQICCKHQMEQMLQFNSTNICLVSEHHSIPNDNNAIGITERWLHRTVKIVQSLLACL